MLADLRYSLRGLARSPGLTSALVLTIALGIGGNAIVYGFIRGSLEQRTVVRNPAHVVSVFRHDPQGGFLPLSASEVEAIAHAADSSAAPLESAGAVREDRDEVEFNGTRTAATVGAATPGFLTTLGIARAEMSAGTVVVSRRLWVDVFGAPSKIVGQTLLVNGQPHKIAAVAPEGFNGLFAGRPIDLWMPIELSALGDDERNGRAFWSVARTRGGATTAAATAAIVAALGGDDTVLVLPFSGVDPHVAGGLRRISATLPIAAAIVFLIACANVATFLLSRAVSRSHETSVRVAIGATRERIRRQLFVDALLISLAGAAAGATLALWASRLVPALLYAEDAEQLSFAPGVMAVLASCVICVAITVLCGLLPLSEVRDHDPASVLRRESGGLSNRARHARTALVTAQMAACCFLLISAGLLLAAFRLALTTSVGSRLGEPVVATLSWTHGFSNEREGDDFYTQARRLVLETPGVTSAEWTSALPGAASYWRAVRVEPRATGAAHVSWRADFFPPEAPATLIVTPKSGRMFGARDRIGACPAAMLNESAAALYGGDPVGRLIEDPSGQAIEIVGVVSVVSKARPDRPAPPTVYYYRENAAPPVTPGSIGVFRIPLRTDPDLRGSLDSEVVGSGYFDSIGARLESGSALPADLKASACRVAVVNVEAQERFFGGQAVGRSFLTAANERVNVIGVVKTFPLRVSEPAREPTAFFAMAQNFMPRMTLVIGTNGRTAELVPNLRQRLGRLDGQLVPPRVVTLDEHLSMTSLASARIGSTLFAVCALLAVVLSMMGVYGAMADAVYQRRREMALRAALGAQGWRLTRQVLGEGLRLSAIGALAGALAAAAVERWGLDPMPGHAVWRAWAAAPFILLVVVLAAAWVPARRAAGASPLLLMKDV